MAFLSPKLALGIGFYLTRDPVLHLERGGGGDGGGKKGVFPSETELRELCLEGGREGGRRDGMGE